MREIATAKLAGCDHVEVRDGDAYRLASIAGAFTGGLAMHWWSHVPRARHDEFLAGRHARLGPGAVAFLIVKNYFTEAELRAQFGGTSA
jgi:hypothetical protein